MVQDGLWFSADAGVKVFGNTDEFHFKWKIAWRAFWEDMDKKLLKKYGDCFLTSSRARKSISFSENSMCVIVSMGLQIGRHCRVDGLRTTEFSLYSSGGWKSRIRMSWIGSVEGPLVGYTLLLSCGTLTWLRAQ